MTIAVPPLGHVQAPVWAKSIGGGARSVLDHLLKQGIAVQAALPALLDLSQPSVARLVSGFVADGMVAVSGRAATGRGNPSVELSLIPDYAFSLGAGIMGDALSMALVDFAGTVRATRRIAVADPSRQAVVTSLGEMREAILADTGIDPARLVGTGVGFSGFFVDEPLRFNPPALMHDWIDADPLATLAPALGTSLLCDNDATAAALAESLLGVGRSCSSFAYCHLTNGFGGALVADGRPVRGALGNAGDFGAVWWLLDQGYPSLDRLRALVNGGDATFATVESMLAEIDAATPGVERWLAEAERPFATLAFLLGHVVAPEKVVIGGRLPAWLATALAGRIRLPQSPPRHGTPFPLPTVVPREVHGEATAIGAALMPLQRLFFR